jgi:hypothetical protein
MYIHGQQYIDWMWPPMGLSDLSTDPLSMSTHAEQTNAQIHNKPILNKTKTLTQQKPHAVCHPKRTASTLNFHPQEGNANMDQD